MAALPRDVRVLYGDSAVVLGAWSNLAITDLRGAIRREHVGDIARCYRAVQKQYPKGLAVLTLIPGGTPMGDASIRSESSKMLEDFAGVLQHISIVLEGTGIWSATMRTVLRGMTIVARTPYTVKVHDELESAARSLAPLIDGGPTERDIVELVQRFRRTNSAPRVVNG
jgi:hypothetical protein